jgi:DNA-binding SARP family transcriptional activator/pimeloyl-ACP methyl ester carboxylesterase
MADQERLRLRLIGEITLERGGVPLPLPASRKTRALLAYLAATGAAHRRDRLCALLWEVPDDPKGALRWSLSKLRALLDMPGRSRLIADGESIRLDLTGIDVDLADLRAVAASPGATHDEALEKIAAMDGGAFCEGLQLARCDEFDGWCAAMREDVRQMRLAVLRELVTRFADDAVRAVPHVRQLAALDPLDETVRVKLVELLTQAGRHDEAEEQRNIAARVLEEAGIAVPDDLRRTGPNPRALDAAMRPEIRQHVRFCAAPDGTGIAYSLVGEGPPLVKAANWLNHLEFEWDSPIWRHWIDELSRGRTLLRYDERGNGLSDWRVKNLSFEAFVEDLETVVDAAGLDRFDMVGISQGCAVSIAYIVRNPGRVRRLVLFGGYAMGWAIRAEPDEIERREAMIMLTRSGWGQDNSAFRQLFTNLYFPQATTEEIAWFNELQRVSASPEGAQRLQRVLSEIDVRKLLPLVDVPTLVFHCRNDAVIPFEAGRGIAARIPGARFVALESDNHLVLEHESAWPHLVRHMRDFLDAPD